MNYYLIVLHLPAISNLTQELAFSFGWRWYSDTKGKVEQITEALIFDPIDKIITSGNVDYCTARSTMKQIDSKQAVLLFKGTLTTIHEIAGHQISIAANGSSVTVGCKKVPFIEISDLYGEMNKRINESFNKEV